MRMSQMKLVVTMILFQIMHHLMQLVKPQEANYVSTHVLILIIQRDLYVLVTEDMVWLNLMLHLYTII